MSTRGLFSIRHNGETYWNYNHCDSYPTGLGIEAVKFLHELRTNPEKKERLLNTLPNLIAVNADDNPTIDEAEYYKNTFPGWQPVSTCQDWYSHLRNLQGIALFKELAGNGKKLVKHYIDSGKLYIGPSDIEWCYCLNFDTERLEVHEGLQYDAADNDRLPCKLIAKIPMNTPTAAMEAILKDIENGTYPGRNSAEPEWFGLIEDEPATQEKSCQTCRYSSQHPENDYDVCYNHPEVPDDSCVLSDKYLYWQPRETAYVKEEPWQPEPGEMEDTIQVYIDTVKSLAKMIEILNDRISNIEGRVRVLEKENSLLNSEKLESIKRGEWK